MTTTEKFQQKLSDSKSARWTALLIVAITMMFGYFFTDVMSPLEPLLTAAKEDGGLGLGWTSDLFEDSILNLRGSRHGGAHHAS